VRWGPLARAPGKPPACAARSRHRTHPSTHPPIHNHPHLTQALPILNEALAALDTIKEADISYIRKLPQPPTAIKLVLEAVCVILDVKPAKGKDESGGCSSSGAARATGVKHRWPGVKHLRQSGPVPGAWSSSGAVAAEPGRAILSPSHACHLLVLVDCGLPRTFTRTHHPTAPAGKPCQDFWKPSLQLLNEKDFLGRLKGYDKDNIPPRLIQVCVRGEVGGE
jgi:hypothetical protein